MKLLNLKLTNFRKISNLPESTITFNQDINVLVGANNAGKTSILNAIQRLFKTEEITSRDLNYLIKDGNLVIEGDVLFTKEQWKSYLTLGVGNKDTWLTDDVDLDILAKMFSPKPISLKQQKGYIEKKETSFYISAKIDKDLLERFTPSKIEYSVLTNTQNQIASSNFYNVYKSPLYIDSKGKILDQEQFVPLNQIDEKTYNNSVNIRGLLYALKVKDSESFKIFKKRLLEIFTELDDIDVVNNEFLGQFELILHEKLRKNGTTENVTYDINNVGQGMQTLVLMLSTILLLKPSIVLMDEPEVHMHPSLIKEFVKYIQLLSVDTQFIITTHSLVLIQEVGLDKVFSLKNEIEQKGIIVSKVDDKIKLLETVEQLGYDVDTLTYTLKPFVFTEGPSDKDFILAFAEKAGLQAQINSFSTAFVAMGGKGNRHKLTNLIDILNREDFIDSPLIMILDKDETANDTIEDIRSNFFSNNPKRLHYLSKRQIENYLIDEIAIKNLIEKILVGKRVKDITLINQWQSLNFNDKLLELVEVQKDKIQENFISELFINDSLVNAKRITEILKSLKEKPLNQSIPEFTGELFKTIGIQTSQLSQKTNSVVTEFENNWASNKIEMCDGRELLKSISQWIQSEYKVSFSNPELIEAMDKIPDEIHSLLIQLTKPDELKIERGVS
jgi:predicted ATP-dependent endonuclease of OLD family